MSGRRGDVGGVLGETGAADGEIWSGGGGVVEGDFDPSKLVSNEFEMEWPPKSGKKKMFPEIDEGRWFSTADAKIKIKPALIPLIDELLLKISK